MRVLFLILSFYCLSCGKTRKKEVFNEILDKSKILASIDYSSQGCFGGETYKLTILYQDGEKIALLTINKKIISTIKLDSNRIKTFDLFLAELKEKKFDLGCTTTDYYLVTIRNDKFEKIDGSCDWNGFSNLRNSLFNE